MLRPRILVVDDDMTTLVVLRNELEAAGYDVHTAHGALRIQHEVRETKPDLVLLDREMPGYSGAAALELLRHLMSRGSLPTVPVAMMSHDEGEAVESEARSKGAVAHIPKSVGTAGVLDAVQAVLDWQAHGYPVEWR